MTHTSSKLEKKKVLMVNLKLKFTMQPVAEPGIKDSKWPSSLMTVTFDYIKSLSSYISRDRSTKAAIPGDFIPCHSTRYHSTHSIYS
jgi:hypothetical protein